MTVAIVDSGAAHARANQATAPTVGPINSTGAALLVANISCFAATSTLAADSKGNTWTAQTARASLVGSARPFYLLNGTVGSGHTIAPATGTQFEVEFAAFSGIDTSGGFISESAGATSGSTSIQPGACSGTFGFLVTGMLWYSGANEAVSINNSYSITDQQYLVSSTNPGGAMAWKETSSAIDPTWSWATPATASIAAAWQMAFAVPAAVAARASTLTLMGV